MKSNFYVHYSSLECVNHPIQYILIIEPNIYYFHGIASREKKEKKKYHKRFNFIGLKITRSPECAAIYYTRRIARGSRGSLLRGTDSRYTPVWRSALEHGLLREKGVGSEAGLPSTFIRASIERFERTAREQEVIRIFVLRANGNFIVRVANRRIKWEKERQRDFPASSTSSAIYRHNIFSFMTICAQLNKILQTI